MLILAWLSLECRASAVQLAAPGPTGNPDGLFFLGGVFFVVVFVLRTRRPPRCWRAVKQLAGLFWGVVQGARVSPIFSFLVSSFRYLPPATSQ